MKTKEFIERVEKLGFEVDEYKTTTRVKTSTDSSIILISEKYSDVFETNYFRMEELYPETRTKLVEIFIEYANTPIENREDRERGYFLKFVYLKNNVQYLNYFGDGFMFADEVDTEKIKTIFTYKEIKQLPDWVHAMLKQGYLVKEEVE